MKNCYLVGMLQVKFKSSEISAFLLLVLYAFYVLYCLVCKSKTFETHLIFYFHSNFELKIQNKLSLQQTY